MPQNKTSFRENIDSLLDELKLAIQWDRPSILVAVHPSRLGQQKAERELQRRLEDLGQRVIKIQANAEAGLVQPLFQAGERAKTSVFFISNLERAEGAGNRDAYKTLNLHREAFVENKTRVVLWLTPSEATHLANDAPDFWAFRHRVLEFTAPRALSLCLPAGVLLWHVRELEAPRDEIEEKIAAHLRLLSELPDRAEAVAARIELLCVLGHLHWSLGNLEQARERLSDAMAMTRKFQLSDPHSRVLNGLAIIHYERAEYNPCLAFYEEALQAHPRDSLLWINASFALGALGKNSVAVSYGKKAARLDSSNAKIWNRLGYVFIALGRTDEAIACYRRATELAPTCAPCYVSLAIGYSQIGLLGEARSVLEQARQHSDQGDFYFQVYEEALLGRPDLALERLGRALSSKRMARIQVERDPNLRLLLDEASLQAVLSSGE